MLTRDRSIKDQFLGTFEAARRSAKRKTTWHNFNTTRGLQKIAVQYDGGECRMSSTDGRIVCIASLLLRSAFLLHDAIVLGKMTLDSSRLYKSSRMAKATDSVMLFVTL